MVHNGEDEPTSEYKIVQMQQQMDATNVDCRTPALVLAKKSQRIGDQISRDYFVPNNLPMVRFIIAILNQFAKCVSMFANMHCRKIATTGSLYALAQYPVLLTRTNCSWP